MMTKPTGRRPGRPRKDDPRCIAKRAGSHAIIKEIVNQNLTPARYNRNVTDSMIELILVRVAGGDTIARVCEELGVTSGSVYQRAYNHPEFGAKLREAMTVGMHTKVDTMFEIAANENIPVDRAKLIIDTIWKVAKTRARDVYGDKVQIDQRTVNINLTNDDLDIG